MNPWLEMGLSNGMVATLLAVAAALATRFCRRPQVAFALWLLVLAKLLTPAVFSLPLASLRPYVALDAGPGLAPVVDTAALSLDDGQAATPMWEMVRPWPEIERQDPELGPEDIDELVAGRPLPFDESADTAAPELDSEDVPLEPILADEMSADELPAGELIFTQPVELTAAAPSSSTLPPYTFAFESEPTHEPAIRRWFGIAAWAWLIGSILWCLLAAVRVARFARLVRRAEPAGKELRDEVRRLARRMGLTRAPDVRLLRRRVPPLVWAMSGRPTMLLPAELVAGLSRRQRETLLAHELAHLARRDDLVRWLELAAIGLYWWHPVTWWARHNLETAQEQCCDARVVALLPGSARAYAETLLATVEYLADGPRAMPLGASGFSQIGPLHRRLTMILKQNTVRGMAWPLRAALVAIGLLVLPVSLEALWAEPAAPEAAPAESDEIVVDAAEPAAQAEPAEATERVEAVEPVAPLETVDEVEAVEPLEPLEAIEEEEVSDISRPAPVEEVEEIDSRPAIPAAPPEHARPAPPAKRAIPAAPPERARRAAPAARAIPGVPAEGAQPATREDRSLEERMERLERMLEKLTTQQTSKAPQAVAPTIAPAATRPAARRAPEKDTSSRGGNSVLDRRVLQDLALQSSHDLTNIMREGAVNYELAKTNYERMEAAHRQYDAVVKAYDSGTITADQVLEAMRRRAEAETSCARQVCTMAPNSGGRYVYALACLVAAEQARRDAKQFWSELADRGAPRKEIEQAREEYSRFETMARECEGEFREAEEYRVAVVEWRGAGQTFRAHQPKPSPAPVETLKSTTKIDGDVEEQVDALNGVASERFQEKVLETQKAEMQIQAANGARKLRALEAHYRLQLAETARELEALQAKQSQLLKQWEARHAEYSALEKVLKSETRQHDEAGSPVDDKPGTPKAAPPKAAPPAAPKQTDGARHSPVRRVFVTPWEAANQALTDSRQTWKLTHQRSQQRSGVREAAEEAQAREQYFRMKALAQQWQLFCAPVVR